MKKPIRLLLALLAAACTPMAFAEESATTGAVPRHVLLDLPTTAGGLTAKAAAARAVQVAPSVRAAVAAFKHARYSEKVTAAGFAPRLDLRARYTRLSRVDLPPLTFNGVDFDNPFPQILNNYALQAQLTIPLTDYFLTTLPKLAAHTSGTQAAAYQQKAERQAVAALAQQAFYAYVRARAALLVAEDALRLLKAHVTQLQALLTAGRATQADFMEARAKQATAAFELAHSQSAVRVATDVLRKTLHLPADEAIHIHHQALSQLPSAAPAQEDFVRSALRQRPDVLALRQHLRMHEANWRSAQGLRWPSLSVNATVDYANPNPRILPQEEKFTATWAVGALLAWSPNDTILRGLPTSEARLQLLRTQSALSTLERQVAIEASRALNALQAALEGLAPRERGIEAAREAWRVRQNLFRAGKATSTDVLNAEDTLQRAQLAHVDARIAVLLAESQLRFVSGELSP